jgi:hypothetical protein
MLVERAIIRKVQQSLLRDRDDGSIQKFFRSTARVAAGKVAFLIRIRKSAQTAWLSFTGEACCHFNVITSVGNYSRTCGGDTVCSGSSQLSEQVTTFQHVAKRRKIYNENYNLKFESSANKPISKFLPSKYRICLVWWSNLCHWYRFQAARTFTFLWGIEFLVEKIDNVTLTIWGVIPSIPLDVTFIAEDIEFLDNDIGLDYYVGLVRYVLNGHEFEQDVPSLSLR